MDGAKRGDSTEVYGVPEFSLILPPPIDSSRLEFGIDNIDKKRKKRKKFCQIRSA